MQRFKEIPPPFKKRVVIKHQCQLVVISVWWVLGALGLQNRSWSEGHGPRACGDWGGFAGGLTEARLGQLGFRATRVCARSGGGGCQEQSRSAAGPRRGLGFILHVTWSLWRPFSRGLTAGSGSYFRSSLRLPGNSTFYNPCVICVKWHHRSSSSHLSPLMGGEWQ